MKINPDYTARLEKHREYKRYKEIIGKGLNGGNEEIGALKEALRQSEVKLDRLKQVIIYPS